ncbi:unnamed protein product [Rangifer tarandus platyrhynchus]|uniref:Uncharacterized protein n=1 Tax=Rangifer tarandus platyrhynchus TaxID=3082113 RepID=A0AC59YX60_RANTA
MGAQDRLAETFETSDLSTQRRWGRGQPRPRQLNASPALPSQAQQLSTAFLFRKSVSKGGDIEKLPSSAVCRPWVKRGSSWTQETGEPRLGYGTFVPLVCAHHHPGKQQPELFGGGEGMLEAPKGTQVRALVQEDSTCCGATKSKCHNY